MKCSELKSAVQTKDKNLRKQIEELKRENTELRVRSEVDADGYSIYKLTLFTRFRTK